MITSSVNRPWQVIRPGDPGQTVVLHLCLTCFLLALLATSVHAAPTAGGALPWDTPIDRIGDAISGPVAYLFGLGGLVVLGVRWIFGGEMGSMTRALLTTIIGLCLLVLAARFLQVLFGVTSALVAG